MLELEALLIDFRLLSHEHAIKYGSQSACSLLIAHNLDPFRVLLGPISLFRDVVGQITGELIDEVLLAALSAALAVECAIGVCWVLLLGVENVSNVLVLGHEDDAHVQTRQD